MRRLALGGALAALLTAVIAATAAAPARDRAEALAGLPSARNPGARGLGAVAAWLAATGRAAAVLEPGDADPAPGAVRLLLAPAAPLDEAEAVALVARAARGGLVVWAMGEAPQPALERLLEARRLPGRGERLTAGAGDDPLLGGLLLRTGGAGATSGLPGARPATGPEQPAAAVTIPVGAGQVLLLGGPEPLDDAHLPEADALSLWVRLAARGPIAFDERWLRPRAAGGRPSTPLLAGLQALLLALALLAALAPRLGAVRPPPPSGSGSGAREYLASLAALYRRSGAEEALAADAWRRLRRRLERTAGVPARATDEDAASRLEPRLPGVAAALRRGAAALAEPGPGRLLAVSRAAADAEAALAPRRRGAGAPFDSARIGR